jgi:hypothetical protein
VRREEQHRNRREGLSQDGCEFRPRAGEARR